MLKRLLDMIVSASALLLLSPILLIICLILRFSGEGEVFFGQERIGYKGKPFRITKFATMVKSAAVIAQGDYTVQNDPRVLPVGRFLRKSKINELMQLWDVLRGEMSLVGPRPQIPTTQAYYPPFYQDVLVHVRPGITGVGSLAFRDEEAILTRAVDRDYCYMRQIIPYKAELENWYAANRSLLIDVALIGLTAWYVVSPRSTALLRLLPGSLHRDISSFDGIEPQERQE
ncbi:lipid carrier--UDP-N-acetylgalactosaminyltransferase [Rhizorhabdus wittichii DC-6]|nr:lipid carrier--UDP-N-acetylgalactosaminyltransferase [Rhizorhabdus wittichii DC-6]